MRPSVKFLVPTLAASVLLAACGSSSSSSSVAAPPQPAAATGGNRSNALVKTASSSKLGTTVLVNAQGMTLYHLSVEHSGKFICTSAKCVQTWPPLTVKPSGRPSGAVASLGTVKRPDGTLQVTYKGMPLYTFAHDTSAGQANGQGIKDVGTWSAVTKSASPSSAPSAPASSTSSGGGKSYGY